LNKSPIGTKKQNLFNNYFYLFCRSENLTELLITCLKKGNESEGKLAAIVASIFCVQIGEPDDELFVKLRDAIMPILRDETNSPSLRTSVCLFNSSNDFNLFLNSMHKQLVLFVLLQAKIYP
jgi:hypothetical protein